VTIHLIMLTLAETNDALAGTAVVKTSKTFSDEVISESGIRLHLP